MRRFSISVLNTLAIRLTCSAGVEPADAAILADSLVQADLGGNSTHGLSRLSIYLKRIQAGLTDPRAKLGVDRQRRGVVALDAANGLGQVQAVRALEMLIPMARDCGVASATLRRSQHFGALSYYCNRAAESDMVLLAMSNGELAMSPEGGSQPFFSTNPLAASFPTGKGYPVKFDLATSIVARGNVIAAMRRGQPIPAGWALDPDGNPTTDAAQAMLGTVLTMAGHKGYALAMMVECFSAVLSGSAVGSAVGMLYKQLDRPQNVGHFLCLFDISAFMDVAEFKQRMDETIDRIKSVKKRPGVEEILIPGERSHRLRQENLRLGIPLDEVTVRELDGLCEQFELPQLRLGEGLTT